MIKKVVTAAIFPAAISLFTNGSITNERIFFYMYHFIVNPNSRSGRGKQIWNTVRKQLDLEQIQYKFYLTQYVGHAQTLARQITSAESGTSMVHLVVLGGDGTIHEVLSGIQDLSSVIFGFIPAGSGNDFCRGMNLPTNPLEALDLILHGTMVRPVDVPYLLCGDRHVRFGISTGIGYDAAVCQEIASSSWKHFFNKLRLGKLVYLAGALKQFLLLDLHSASLVLDGDRNYRYDRVYFIAVMNQKYEGGGFRFCPKARPDDQILDVIVAEKMPKLKLLFYLPSAYWGGHVHAKGIHIYRCKSAEIHSSIPLPVHIDGESGGIQTRMEVRLEKQQISMILPSR